MREVFVQALYVRTVSWEIEIGFRRLAWTVLKKEVNPAVDAFTGWFVRYRTRQCHDQLLERFHPYSCQLRNILPQKYVLEFCESRFLVSLQGS